MFPFCPLSVILSVCVAPVSIPPFTPIHLIISCIHPSILSLSFNSSISPSCSGVHVHSHAEPTFIHPSSAYLSAHVSFWYCYAVHLQKCLMFRSLPPFFYPFYTHTHTHAQQFTYLSVGLSGFAFALNPLFASIYLPISASQLVSRSSVSRPFSPLHASFPPSVLFTHRPSLPPKRVQVSHIHTSLFSHLHLRIFSSKPTFIPPSLYGWCFLSSIHLPIISIPLSELSHL